MYQMSRLGPGPAGYELPPMIGFDKHDTRRERKPMYSMRKRPSTRFDTIGPGPAKYVLDKITKDGLPNVPKYSLAMRLNPLSKDVTPGPGAHNNDKAPRMNENRPPVYSFGIRLLPQALDQVPGPKYAYDLNNYKTRNPAYTMRYKTAVPYALEGPGPAKYGDLNRNLTHKRSANYTMRQKFPITGDRGPSPGPNQYALMNMKPGASAPQYSFGVRHSMWRPPMIIPGDNC
ncbi:outer dense fiber protein 3 [Topomyia yanbarensis]|uniref:outer dense fiber protein 3 n=1 Tax=Topomyia yanbarensis TaxID=2498891 RepID=UPI00273AC7D4|nr:outer dense fiber protein 3 [Topomyia yanbarensis]